MKCGIMLHFIRVFTLCQSIRLEISSKKRVNKFTCYSIGHFIQTCHPFILREIVRFHDMLHKQGRLLEQCIGEKVLDPEK